MFWTKIDFFQAKQINFVGDHQIMKYHSPIKQADKNKLQNKTDTFNSWLYLVLYCFDMDKQQSFAMCWCSTNGQGEWMEEALRPKTK